MSRFIRRFRHFMRRIFSRNRHPRRRPDHDSDLVQIQDKHDSDSVQIQDKHDSDSVQLQDQQDSDCVQIQDQQESDCVLIQDQQDSDPAQIQDQQESDPVQIQDQQESDCTNTRSSQESDSVQIQDQQDSDPVQIQDQGRSNFAPIDQPSNFDDVTHIFSSHLAALHADPGRLDDVRESWTFKLCLHCTAYRISVCGYKIYFITSYLKHHAELARLGFYSPRDEDIITREEKKISDLQEEKAVLTRLLGQARDLGLGQDVDSVTRAAQVDMEVRRLMRISCDEVYSGRWDQVLRYIAESVNLLSERHEAWPSWPDLDQTHQRIMEPERLYGHEDRDREAELLVLGLLLLVSYRLLPPHAGDVRKYVNFHCRYLDQEAGLMGSFIAQRSADSHIQAVGKLMTGDDEEFCSLSIELLDDFIPPLPTHRFGLRLYRLCLRLGEWDLADTVMRMRFEDNPDEQQVREILNQLLTKLPCNPRQTSDRMPLSDHDDVTNEYKLPELLPNTEKSLRDKPWWVEVFRQKHQQPKPVQVNPPTCGSASSEADTRLPSTSFEEECHRAALVMIQERLATAADPRSVNRQVARLFITTDSIRDRDTYTIPFLYISADVDNSIPLKHEDQEQKTNIAAGVPYHCRVLTYHPVQDEWSVTSDMCRISGPLDVEQEGATCVPFVGDCGVLMKSDAFVYKIHKSRSEHALREYMADVRTQSTAAWYVTRFRELTKDRFGVLMMLHSDLVIVYQDSHRDTMLELTTREIHHRPVGSAVKFDKYTSNTSYINRKVNTELLESFSHFTHHESGRTLMVTDLQGWVGIHPARDNINYTLTDPVIHCPGLYYRFGGTNREHQGIRDFFQHVHPTCNHICESLNLTRPEEYRV